jgi:hypothetical protein
LQNSAFARISAAVVEFGDVPVQRSAPEACCRCRVRHVDQQIARLGRAKAYLERLRQCTDDDPATHCPYLADEILDYTPRGRTVPPPGTVAEPADFIVTDQAADDEMPSRFVSCRHCRGPVEQPRRGRRLAYCSCC